MFKKTTWFRIILLLVLLVVCLLALRQGKEATNVVIAATQPADLMGSAPNCRYGLTPLHYDQVPLLTTFQAGWFLNFEAIAPSNTPPGVEFVRIIGIKQNKTAQGQYLPGYYLLGMSFAQIAAQAQANPGSLWLIGNEVDRGPDPNEIEGGQGDMYPNVYATAYHDLYFFIKAADPTARIGISGLVEVTPGRLQYLDLVWQSYYDQYGVYIPVDVWNMHIYILPEAHLDGQPNGVANVALGTDPALAIRESGKIAANCPNPGIYCWAEHDNLDIFKGQVVAMRTWMKAHGQQNKPLILSEFSILYAYEIDDNGCFQADEYGQCFTPERVSTFAQGTLTYLQYEAIDPSLGYPADNYRLVQQWLWFAIYSGNIGHASNLVEEDLTTLTLTGHTFKNFIAALPSNTNLFPTSVPGQWADIVPPATTADAPMVVWLSNNGNTLAPPFTVTFYSDAGLSQPIASTVVNNVRGCARDEYEVTATWPGLPAGVHQFWVKVDSTSLIGETNENDNVGTGLVVVGGDRVYLPITRR
jgi:hypothetical protein